MKLKTIVKIYTIKLVIYQSYKQNQHKLVLTNWNNWCVLGICCCSLHKAYCFNLELFHMILFKLKMIEANYPKLLIRYRLFTIIEQQHPCFFNDGRGNTDAFVFSCWQLAGLNQHFKELENCSLELLINPKYWVFCLNCHDFCSLLNFFADT